MKAPWRRALQGAVLSVGSPLGWLLLRLYDGANPVLELTWRAGVYVYMLVGTFIAFTGFGWYVGRQEEREHQTGLHDELTGLSNARYFRRRLGDEHALALRHARPLALIIGDLDRFKAINDGHGHAVGDRVLEGVGKTFLAMRRRGDTLARIGGEEFAVLLPETDLAEAVRVAERLRVAVSGLSFACAAEPGTFSITMSFGVAVLPAGSELSSEALFMQADRAMYRAKEAGRNTVCAGAPGSPRVGALSYSG